MLWQGRNNTKIVGWGQGLKILVSRQRKFGLRAQMALKCLGFFMNIFRYVQGFSCSLKQFLRTFFILQGLFM